MQAADTLVRDAFGLDPSRFARRYGHYFLLRLPLTADESWDDGIGYDTVVGEIPGRTDGALAQHQLAVAGWRVAPLVKRDGNPFPERVSVGRARSCDVVLRIPQVSKLHAHFLFDPKGRLLVRDQRSANGTRVNGRRLRPSDPCTVKSGDQVAFGRFVTELIDAPGLQKFLTRGDNSPAAVS